MKGKFTPYIMLILAACILAGVHTILGKEEVDRSAVTQIVSQIDEISQENIALTQQRDGLTAAYKVATSMGEMFGISNNTDDLPQFLWVDEERQTRDSQILYNLAQSYCNYKATGDAKYISGKNLDVYHVSDDFLPDFSRAVIVTEDYNVAPYRMGADYSVSYYGAFYYAQENALHAYGVLYDVTVSKSGNILAATAYSIYPG